MKRSFVLVAMAFLLIGSFAFGEKAVLIDFSNLEPDIVADENGKPTVNSRTVMDFSKISSIPFDDTQKALMRTSLVLTDWEVQLNSSARIVANMQRSVVKSAPVISGPFEGKNVMGVRVVFPTAPVNANARIKPPSIFPHLNLWRISMKTVRLLKVLKNRIPTASGRTVKIRTVTVYWIT